MYDVIRQKNIKGKTWLLCLDDEREDALILQAENLVAANQDIPVIPNGHGPEMGNRNKPPTRSDLRLSLLKMEDTLLPCPEEPLACRDRPHSRPSFVFITTLLPESFPDILLPPPRT
jgi:hypothetical protein